ARTVARNKITCRRGSPQRWPWTGVDPVSDATMGVFWHTRDPHTVGALCARPCLRAPPLGEHVIPGVERTHHCWNASGRVHATDFRVCSRALGALFHAVCAPARGFTRTGGLLSAARQDEQLESAPSP